MAGLDEINSTLKGLSQNLSNLVSAQTSGLFAGSFTLANATVTNVTQVSIIAGSFITITPTNATAALTQRTNGLFVSSQTASVGFSVSTQNGSALGSETFKYIVYNL
jgi:hypothetical protein